MSNRLEELKDAMASVAQENDRIADSFKIETKDDSDGYGSVGVVVSPEQRDAYAANLGKMREIKALIELEEESKGLARWMNEPATESVADAVATAIARGVPVQQLPRQLKSIGEMFLDSNEYKALVDNGSYDMKSPWMFEGSDISNQGGHLWREQKDIYTASAPAATTRGFGTTQFDPIVMQGMRTPRVRDLFPAVATTANLIDFYRVSGFTNAASVVPERVGANNAFALKPQSALTFALGQAPVRTIAHYEVAHRNVLADEPQLQSLINTELLYGLRLHEDYQILSGAGTSEDLVGILNSGISTQAKGSDTAPDAIRKAMTKVVLAYFEPTGVVLHPTDWETIEILKDTTGQYITAGSVSVGAVKTLWTMPVVATPAIAQGTALVGAFGLGAQLYDREIGSVRIAEQHSDFFVRNAITILAEERLALAVKRPESFCKVTGL